MRTWLQCGLLGAALSGLAWAQYPPPVGPYGPGGYGGYGWGYNNGGTTVAGSTLQGMSSVISAQGQANLLNSMALSTLQDARSKELDNRIKGTNTYFQMRQLNTQYRAMEAGPKKTMEDFVRYAQAAVPAELSPSQLDPVSGQINWPLALQNADYAASRQQVEAFFSARSTRPASLTADEVNAGRQAAQQLMKSLQDNIRQVQPQDYTQARRFMDRILYETGAPQA